MQAEYSLVRVLAIKVGLFVVLAFNVPTSAIASGEYPNDEVVVRFSIDPSVLDDVTNVPQLASALHRELRLEAASPLDFEVVVHITANIYQNRAQQQHAEGSAIMVNLDKGKPLNDRVKDLRFYTYGDFDEEEAWKYFGGKIQEALLYSMNASGAFKAGEDGTVWTSVSSVSDGSNDLSSENGSMVVEISAELLYRDGSKFGSKQPPSGYRQTLNSVQILLEPAEPQAAEAEPQTSPQTEVAEATSPEGGISGEYGYDPGGLGIEKIDGQYVMYDVRKSPPQYMLLTPIGDGQYSVDYNGVMAKLTFSVDENGQAFSISVEQEGHTIKLPRK